MQQDNMRETICKLQREYGVKWFYYLVDALGECPHLEPCVPQCEFPNGGGALCPGEEMCYLKDCAAKLVELMGECFRAKLAAALRKST